MSRGMLLQPQTGQRSSRAHSCHGDFSRQGAQSQNTAPPQKKTRSSSVSAWHAFLASKYRRTCGKTDIREAAVGYQRLKSKCGVEWDQLQELGKVGRQAIFAGARPFGPKPKPAGKATRPKPSVDSLVVDVQSIGAIITCDSERDAMDLLDDRLHTLREAQKVKASVQQEETAADLQHMRVWEAGRVVGPHTRLPAEARQPAPASYGFSYNPWSCQALSLAQLVVQGIGHGMGIRLTNLWTERHQVCTAEKAADIGPAPNQVTKCCRNGICLCSPNGLLLDAFADQLRSVMRPLLEKKAPLRPYYEQGALIMELQPVGSESFWFSVTQLNLKTLEGTILRLFSMGLPNVGAEAIWLRVSEVEPDLGCMEFHSALSLVVSQGRSPCSVKWWRTVRIDALVNEFVPGYVLVVPQANIAVNNFWEGFPRPKPPRAPQRRGSEFRGRGKGGKGARGSRGRGLGPRVPGHCSVGPLPLPWRADDAPLEESDEEYQGPTFGRGFGWDFGEDEDFWPSEDDVAPARAVATDGEVVAKMEIAGSLGANLESS